MIPDLVLVGGGLANSLIAWRLAMRRPEIRVVILEQERTLGGNHTWSFHGTDLSTAQREWLSPLVQHDWRGHEVRFPAFHRQLRGSYHAMTSGSLHREIQGRQIADVRFGERVRELRANGVRLSSGEFLPARAVIDGRGPRGSGHLVLGHQKFIGLELLLEAEHRLENPIIMDATVSQADGYRFMYVLPLGPRRLLVEDTRYSDGADLDDRALRQQALEYAAAQGWSVSEMLREERGVLPILLAGNLDAYWREGIDGVGRSGLNATLFHPTTGYSLPYAVRLADAIADSGQLDGPSLSRLTRRFADHVWQRTRFFRLLNRMLFRAGRPEHRYRVLQRFYGLSEPLIARFYAGQPSLADQARLLTGKPPVPVIAALRCLSERKLLRRELGNP